MTKGAPSISESIVTFFLVALHQVRNKYLGNEHSNKSISEEECLQACRYKEVIKKCKCRGPYFPAGDTGIEEKCNFSTASNCIYPSLANFDLTKCNCSRSNQSSEQNRYWQWVFCIILEINLQRNVMWFLSYVHDVECGEWDDNFKGIIEKFENSTPSDIEIAAFQVFFRIHVYCLRPYLRSISNPINWLFMIITRNLLKTEPFPASNQLMWLYSKSLEYKVLMGPANNETKNYNSFYV